MVFSVSVETQMTLRCRFGGSALFGPLLGRDRLEIGDGAKDGRD